MKLLRLTAALALALAPAIPAVAQSTPASVADLPDAPGPKPEPTPTGPIVVIDTTMGRLTCKTFDKQAPNNVANFIGLADGTKEWTDPTTHAKQRKRFYDGLTFHRVIPGFMVQAGDPVGDGTGDPGYYTKDEISPDLTFSLPGRLAMANSGPDTNGSQFFITEVPTPHLTGHHTIFGQCDQTTIALVRKIARMPRDERTDRPFRPVKIVKITILREAEKSPIKVAKPASKPAK
jgi:peptidyl-prolyl cis-trans isomerase A (cyclophilin A)